MPSSTSFAEPSSTGGTGLLATLTFAALAAVAAIAAFCVHASWWLLPVVLVALLAATGAVVTGLLRLMDDGGVLVPARAAAEPAAAAARPARAGARARRPALGA